ncbi:MAG: DUF4097 domain-containing protein [Clostridium sp.]|nr:DUF4097 domain-containing protein [Clostridium sp.]
MSIFKKTMVVTLIVASVSIGIGAYIIYERGYSIDNFSKDISQLLDGEDINIDLGPLEPLSFRENYFIGDKTNIILQTSLGEIDVSSYDGEELMLSIEGQVAKKYLKDYIDVKESNDQITFKLFDHSRTRTFITREAADLEITLKIPKSYGENLKLSNISDDISVTNINLSNLKIETISGEVDIYEGEIDELDLATVSGDIEVQSQVGFINGESVSGDLSLGNIQGFKIDSVSGDLDISLDHQPKASQGESISGHITLNILGQDEITYDFETISGNITIERLGSELNVGNRAKNKGLNTNVVKTSTISGDITLKN